MSSGTVTVNAGSGSAKFEWKLGGSWVDVGTHSGTYEYPLDNLPQTWRVTANPPSGYSFSSWSYSDTGGATTTISSNPSWPLTLTENITPATITANWSQNPPQTYTGTILSDGNGTATLGGQTGSIHYTAGQTMQLVATPNAGYAFDKWVDFNGTQWGTSATTQTLTTPAGDIWLKALFKSTSFIKVYDGSSWVSRPANKHDGAQWSSAVAKKWTGSSWSTS